MPCRIEIVFVLVLVLVVDDEWSDLYGLGKHDDDNILLWKKSVEARAAVFVVVDLIGYISSAFPFPFNKT